MFGMTLSLRAYAEIFGSIAIIIGFLAFVSHEREVGRQQVMAADAKVVALTIQLNAQKDADAKALVDTATAVYQNTLSKPVAAPKPVRLCLDSLGSGTTGADGGPTGKPDGASEFEVTVEKPGASSGFDIQGITEHALEVDDAQITALQAYIGACQKEGFCQATVPDAVPILHSPPDLGLGQTLATQ